MHYKLALATMALATATLTSCSKMGALSADNFTVNPTPLEAVSGQVPATINGRFPEKYLKKKAVVTVTPVLRYAGGQAVGNSATFQGEKVAGNDQTISYRVGGNYTMKTTFNYVPEMASSELYLTFDAKKGKKTVTIPEVMIGYGVVSTGELINSTLKAAPCAMAEDAYQHIIEEQREANIKFLIQQTKIRTSELKSQSIQDFIQTLKDIRADQKGKELNGIDISAYASPDGAFSLNERLAEGRGAAAKTYAEQQIKEAGLEANVNTKFTAEDWDGFQKLVSASKIQDKEVILRVLSMYQDPEEREAQIRNISAAYTELTQEILPELRRARIMVNYALIGRSDDEIQAQYKADPSKLSVEELLYSAVLTDNAAEKEAIYQTTAKLYSKDYRAFNNLASLAYAKGDYNAAKQYAQKALAANANAAEANVNMGMLSLLGGDLAAAQNYIGKGTASQAAKEALGTLYLKQGNYAQAVKAFGDVNSNSAGLAKLLNKDYMGAAETLASVQNDDAMTYYLKAIVSVRTNNNALAIENLRTAISKDASLAAHAAKDIEFKKLAADAAFQLLTK